MLCSVCIHCALISTFTSFLRRLDPDVVNWAAPRQAWPWHGAGKSGASTRRGLPLPGPCSHTTSFSVYLRIANDLCKEWKIIVLNGKNTLDINQSYNIQNPQNSVIHCSVVTIIALFAVIQCSPYITYTYNHRRFYKKTFWAHTTHEAPDWNLLWGLNKNKTWNNFLAAKCCYELEQDRHCCFHHTFASPLYSCAAWAGHQAVNSYRYLF